MDGTIRRITTRRGVRVVGLNVIGPENSQDLLEALTAEFRYDYFETDPQMRKIVSGLPDIWLKLLCHRGCTGKPSDQGRSVNRALDSLTFHELDTLLDVNPNSEVPVAVQAKRNFVLCSADAEQWSKWYTEIGDPHFKPATCEICGESRNLRYTRHGRHKQDAGPSQAGGLETASQPRNSLEARARCARLSCHGPEFAARQSAGQPRRGPVLPCHNTVQL
jgi:hypothetical protein